MRWVSLTVLLLASLPVVTAAPVPKHLMKDEPFWPTAVGTKWVYEQNGQEMIEEITKAESLKEGVRLTMRLSWGDTSQEIFDVSPESIVQRAVFGRECSLTLIQFPLKTGAMWAFEFNQGNFTEQGEAKVGEDADLKTPAGTFRAKKVVFKVTEKDKKPIKNCRTYTYWFAKGVGLVKLEWDGGGRVLKSFAPGKK